MWQNALVLFNVFLPDSVLCILISGSRRRNWVSFQSSSVISCNIPVQETSCARPCRAVPAIGQHATHPVTDRPSACRLLIDKHSTWYEMLIKVVKLLRVVPSDYLYYRPAEAKYTRRGTHAGNITERGGHAWNAVLPVILILFVSLWNLECRQGKSSFWL